jgi:hypothetical protein
VKKQIKVIDVTPGSYELVRNPWTDSGLVLKPF